MRNLPPVFLSNVKSRENLIHCYESLVRILHFYAEVKSTFLKHSQIFNQLSAQCSVIVTIILYSLPQISINSFRLIQSPK